MAQITDLYIVLLYSPKFGVSFWEHNIEGKNSAIELAENLNDQGMPGQWFKQARCHAEEDCAHCEECQAEIDAFIAEQGVKK